MMTSFDFQHVLNNGVNITSSGTTGVPKTIFRTPDNLKKVIEVAIDAQSISKKSKILTVTRMSHAGGLLTQSLPAYTLGCDIKIQQFNAYTFLKDFKDYTHTFLTPSHMWALMQTKQFENADLSGKRILGGSDPVSWEMIEAFTSKGAVVQPNWGMSEVGPVTINSIFTRATYLERYKKLSKGTILGDKFYTEWKIEDGVLWVKGDLVCESGWFRTGDLVECHNGILFYLGRDIRKDTNSQL
jgi:acyl-CoA synthetase (AMP-forming)/AMP-acid ligase II